MLTANDSPCLSLVLAIARNSAWVAHIEIEGEFVDGPCVLSDGTTRWIGTAARSSELAGVTSAVVWAGNGGARYPLGAAHFRGSTVGKVLALTLAEAGEAKHGNISGELLSTALPYWTRPAGSLGNALTTLAEHVGADWYFAPDGTVWLGTGRCEPADEALAPMALEYDGASGAQDFAPDYLSVLPGDDLGNGPIVSVLYEINTMARGVAWT
jgi:hypothetical protein